MSEDLDRMIKEHFSEKETIELIKKLVSSPSHEGIENQETEVANHIYDFFVKEGIEAEIIPVCDGRCNVIARLKGKGKGKGTGTGMGKTLLLTGHTDTVPPYDMPGNPYEIKIQDGRMFARGVVDMKGGLACMMMAMAAIKEPSWNM
ncbi:MAG: M20/M25/M40 family metallo-hydrolase [Peptostreptococcaceae bacterium]|nr:M20/M25/M40 family metallo-hydrolase [Peptostreptococcaceae bacterium]